MTREFRYGKLWWSIAALMISAVFVLSLIRLPPLPIDAPKNFDKWEHLSAYTLLSSYLGQLLPRFRTHCWAALGLAVMGGLLEYLQSLTSYRSLDMADFFANTLGVMIGLLICRSWLGGVIQRLDQWLSKRLYHP
jgi:VanZ family protein